MRYRYYWIDRKATAKEDWPLIVLLLIGFVMIFAFKIAEISEPLTWVSVLPMSLALSLTVKKGLKREPKS